MKNGLSSQENMKKKVSDIDQKSSNEVGNIYLGNRCKPGVGS
jgi:hypothetical protein